MRCTRIQQGRLSWMTVDQTRDAGIKVSRGNGVWNMTWLFFTVMAQNFCRKTIISHFVSPLQTLSKSVGIAGNVLQQGDDKMGPFWAAGVPQRDRIVPLVVHNAFGKLTNLPKHYFTARFLFLTDTECTSFSTGGVCRHPPLLKADYLVLKLRADAEWLICHIIYKSQELNSWKMISQRTS